MTEPTASTGTVAGRAPRRPVVMDRTALGRPAGRDENPGDRAEGVRDRYMAKLRQVPEIRTDLVSRIRREIQQGDYETSERIEAAVRAIGDEEVDILA